MRNFRFFQREIANLYWILTDSFICVQEYSAKLQAFYVHWYNAYGLQGRWLDIDDMRSIRQTVLAYYGRDSYTYKKWHSLIKLLVKGGPDAVLDEFSEK